MRVMITGADHSTLSRLESYLTILGHETTIAMDGMGCQAGLCQFLPDLIVMELDYSWGGYDGVMATLIADPGLNEIQVVFFTSNSQQLPLKSSPRIIARLRHPSQSQELSRLRDLLDNMELARGGILLSPELDDDWNLACARVVS
ncbi:MAG: hypothetical protein Q8M16_04760 [Pirellulaceae bacterium]|nr:hypothetical protein [Pirellulaceae bacterium]